MFPEELIFTTNKHEEIFDMKPEYPYTIRKVFPKPGKIMIAPWHWHEELEFAYITKGTVVYSTPQDTVQVHEGNGIFINSNVLHRVTAAAPAAEVSYEVHMFKRVFLAGEGSLLDTRYIKPLLQDPSIASIHLEETITDHRIVLTGMLRLTEISDEKAFGYEIKLRNLMFDIWFKMIEIQRKYLETHSAGIFNKEMRLKEMLLYIQEHYMEQISLKDISNAANISERECLRCFQGGLDTTPFAYIQEYRIQTACNMLRNSSDKIVDIAMNCGFNSSSYFGKTFRKQMGCTPYEYRNT